MPSKTAKQARFMAANCYGKGRGKISKKVVCDFAHHDRAKAKRRKR